MKIHFLGTCAGTEPMQGRHHSSFIIETNGAFYQFDAGESCAYTAFSTMGLDLLKTKALFISHPHIDHTGGLPHWIFTMTKLCWVRKLQERSFNVSVAVPELRLWECASELGTDMRRSNMAEYIVYDVNEVHDGTVYQDNNIKVEALHNLHMGVPADGIWRSFSYRIFCEGKTIVFSGDIKKLEDIATFLADGCDLFLCETGHNHPASIAEQLKAYPAPGMVGYIHNGRAFLNNYEESKARTQEILGERFFIAEDAETREF
ncbi:MAG: ribonuclease Z [Lentisphaeria bacterium]|nr:ribonuclease Z [Lentisphaeria bacterium]